MSSTKSTKNFKSGEEPTNLLLALISSQVLTLANRGEAVMLKAKTSNGVPVVYIVIPNAAYDAQLKKIVQVKPDKRNGSKPNGSK